MRNDVIVLIVAIAAFIIGMVMARIFYRSETQWLALTGFAVALLGFIYTVVLIAQLAQSKKEDNIVK
jgi:NADH:ubiquinone oxidoreductase subunit 6 (subunit J)